MSNVLDKKQMYVSVNMGKENASKDCNCIISGFFSGVLGTRFGTLELKIGSLESEKIGSL